MTTADLVTFYLLFGVKGAVIITITLNKSVKSI